MSEAIISLTRKGNFIFDSEAEAVQAAILLHDIGHGPFSHVLEHTLVQGVEHEDISLMLMQIINDDFKGQLNLAIEIFKDHYPKRFLHQLISSQLDMDRLDYLRRDSFFTGVTEGNIGSARIIRMLNVKDDHLVVEKKGIYSIENYLMNRRLMYWQVYLHKTSVAAEKVLINVLIRAKELSRKGVDLFASPALSYFLKNQVDKAWWDTHPEALENYALLDDNDIWCALKVWCHHPDKVLSLLSQDMVNRRIFKVEVSDEPISEEKITAIKTQLAKRYHLPYEETSYLIDVSTVQKDMYRMEDDSIEILFDDGSSKDISQVSDMLNVELLSKKVRKHYLCYQR
jgi:HD superfamily phosphohydrolase